MTTTIAGRQRLTGIVSRVPVAGPRQYTTGAVAKFCGVAPRTVSKWFDAGLLRGYRVPPGNDRRVYHDDLIDFCTERGLTRALAALRDAAGWRCLAYGLAAHDAEGLAGSVVDAAGTESGDRVDPVDSLGLGLAAADAAVKAVVIGPTDGGPQWQGCVAARLRVARPDLVVVAVLSEDAEPGDVPHCDATFRLPCHWSAVAAALRGGK